MSKIKVNFVVLTDTTESEKGNKTTFLSVEKPNEHGFISSIAKGYIKDTKMRKAGEIIEAEIESVVEVAGNTELTNKTTGEDFVPNWLIIN